MTAKASEPVLDAPVDVRFTAKGIPLAVRYDGRVWPVVADPVQWYGRRSWWAEALRAPLGSGDLVSVEHWRVQVRLGSSASALRTFELHRDPLRINGFSNPFQTWPRHHEPWTSPGGRLGADPQRVRAAAQDVVRRRQPHRRTRLDAEDLRPAVTSEPTRQGRPIRGPSCPVP